MSLVTDLAFGYKFEEGTASIVWADVLGTNDLTATGTITSATGIIGQAASGFTNATNYLTLANAPIGATPYSISCWVYFTFTPSGYMWAQTLLGVGKEFLRINAGRNLSIGFETLTYTTTPTQNAWHHVVGVHDGTTLKLYYDGVLRASGTPLTFVVSDAMSVGSRTSAEVLPGRMDSTYGWSRALTDGGVSVGQTAGGEVAALYNGGAALDYPWSTDGGLAATLDAATVSGAGIETVAGVSAVTLGDATLLADGTAADASPVEVVVTRVSFGTANKKRPPRTDAKRRRKRDADVAAAMLLMG